MRLGREIDTLEDGEELVVFPSPIRWASIPVAVAILLILGLAACGGEPLAQGAAQPADLAEQIAAAPPQTRPRMLAGLSSAEAESLVEPLRELGIEHAKEGSSGIAESAFSASRDAALVAGDPRQAAIAEIHLGRVYGRSGRFAAARPPLQSAVERLRAVGDERNLGIALNNLGIVLRNLGRPERAVPLYREALELAERADAGAAAIAGRLHNLGVARWEMGDLDGALEALGRALELKREVGDPAALSSTLGALAATLEARGQTAAAEVSLREALELEGSDPVGFATLANNLGILLRESGEIEEALEILRAGITAASGYPPARANLAATLATTEIADGRPEEALAVTERALAEVGDLGVVPPAVMLHATRAIALDRLGQSAEAITAAEHAVALADQLGQPGTSWQAFLVLGLAREGAGRMDDAAAAYRRSIAEVERLRSGIGAASGRGGFLDRKIEPFHRLLGLEIGRGHDRDALELAERARARALVELLSLPRGAAADPDGAVEAVEDRVVELESAIGRAPDAATRTGLRVELERARRDLTTLEARFAASLPAAPLATSRAGQSDLALPADTVVLAFTVTDARAWIWVRGSGAGVWRSSDLGRAELAREVEGLRVAIEERDLAVRERAAALGERLLRPVAAELGAARRLVVVPDGPLWDLPFAALELDGRPLLRRAAIVLAPSLGVLEILDGRRAATGGVAVVGGPDRPGETALAEQTAAGAAVHRVTAASHLDAALAGRPSILHLAAHGVAEPASPGFSRLELPLGEHDPPRLDARDLARLDLSPVGLAVLGACESGRGRIGRGEGVLGLAWAVLAAGGRNAVVSRWQVDGDATTALMTGLHRRLAAGETDVAGVLRDAALELADAPATAHPQTWAAFAVIGSGRLGPSPERRR